MFKITSKWIHAHKSGAGGWNKLQLRCLGVPWPPIHGWVARLEGTEITEEQKTEFETLNGQTSRKRRAVAAGETPSSFERESGFR